MLALACPGSSFCKASCDNFNCWWCLTQHKVNRTKQIGGTNCSFTKVTRHPLICRSSSCSASPVFNLAGCRTSSWNRRSRCEWKSWSATRGERLLGPSGVWYVSNSTEIKGRGLELQCDRAAQQACSQRRVIVSDRWQDLLWTVDLNPMLLTPKSQRRRRKEAGTGLLVLRQWASLSNSVYDCFSLPQSVAVRCNQS